MSDYDPEIAAVLPRLTSGDPAVRKEAASALGAIGDTAAILAFEQATADPDLEVRKIAARALAQLTAKA